MEVLLILALTGTDIYGDIHDNAQAQASLKLADRLIVLEEEGMTELNALSKPAVAWAKAGNRPPLLFTPQQLRCKWISK